MSGLFDKRHVRRAFSRSAASYDAAAGLQRVEPEQLVHAHEPAEERHGHEQAYLRADETPEIKFVNRDTIDRSDEAWTEIPN